MTREVPLTRGYVALVDDEDFERVSAHSWSVYAVDRQPRAQRFWREGGRVRAMGLGRFILNAPDGLQVDHINRDPLDNRRSNLRLCTRAENARNRRAPQRDNRQSNFKGVYANKRWGKPFLARISVDRKMLWLGTFDDEIEAARAYDRAAIQHHGAFAALNFPLEHA